jgi:TonB family protein
MKRRALLSILCAAAAGAAAAADTPAPAVAAGTAPLLEGCKIPLGAEQYPKQARRSGASGVVTVSFQVNAQGEADQVTLLAGGDGPFAAAAQQILKATRCPLPASAVAAPHYVMDIQFVLLPCRTPAPSGPATSAVMICATRLK